MIAANRARSRGGSRRSSGGSIRSNRRGVGRRTYGLIEAGGALTAAYGLAINGNAGQRGGNSVVGQLRAMNPKGIPGAVAATWNSLKQSGTLTQKQVVGGAVTYAIGRIGRRVLPFTHRLKVHVDRKTSVALT